MSQARHFPYLTEAAFAPAPIIEIKLDPDAKTSPYPKETKIVSTYPLAISERKPFQAQFNQLLDAFSAWGEWRWESDVSLVSLDASQDLKTIPPNILKNAEDKQKPIIIKRNNEFYIYGDQKGQGEEKSWGFTQIEIADSGIVQTPFPDRKKINVEFLKTLPFPEKKEEKEIKPKTIKIENETLIEILKNGHIPATQVGINIMKQRFFLPEYSGHQQAIYFETIKQNLEKIFFALQDEQIPLDKRTKQFDSLCRNFQMCGPGLYTHVEDVYGSLYLDISLKKWLADLRGELIKEYAVLHNKKYKISGGNSIHTFNVFARIAADHKWNPPFSIEKIEESFAAHAQIQEADVAGFYNFFASKYNPASIRYCIASKTQSTLYPFLEKIFDEFGFKIDQWNNSENKDYNKLVTKLEIVLKELDESLNINDILELNEDNQFRLQDANKIANRLCDIEFTLPPSMYYDSVTETYKELISPMWFKEDKLSEWELKELMIESDAWKELPVPDDKFPSFLTKVLENIYPENHKMFLTEMLHNFTQNAAQVEKINHLVREVENREGKQKANDFIYGIGLYTNKLLKCAINGMNPNLVLTLLEAKAKPDATIYQESSPLLELARSLDMFYGHQRSGMPFTQDIPFSKDIVIKNIKNIEDMVKILLQAKADINKKNDQKQSCLTIALTLKSPFLIQAILETNELPKYILEHILLQSIQLLKNNNDTMLSIIPLLLEKKVDVNVPDSKGNTALSLAEDLPQPYKDNIVHRLLEAKAGVSDEKQLHGLRDVSDYDAILTSCEVKAIDQVKKIFHNLKKNIEQKYDKYAKFNNNLAKTNKAIKDINPEDLKSFDTSGERLIKLFKHLDRFNNESSEANFQAAKTEILKIASGEGYYFSKSRLFSGKSLSEILEDFLKENHLLWNEHTTLIECAFNKPFSKNEPKGLERKSPKND